MSKTPPTPRQPSTVDPFRDAPKFNPFGPSPLAGNAAAQQSARGVTVQSAEEWTRARTSPAAPVAPTSQPARAPFPQRVDSPAMARPNKPAAGGSK
jgi:hypothetical protein